MPTYKRIRQPKPVAEFEQPAEHGLYVYADFETFKAGDKFELPEGWERDSAYEELLFTKSKGRRGMTFVTPKGARVTLPIMEV